MATWPPAIWQHIACFLKTVRSHNSNAGQSRSRGHQTCTKRRLMKCQSEWVSADKVNDMHYRRQVDRNRQSNTCGLPNMQYILQAKINNNYIYIYIYCQFETHHIIIDKIINGENDQSYIFSLNSFESGKNNQQKNCGTNQNVHTIGIFIPLSKNI